MLAERTACVSTRAPGPARAASVRPQPFVQTSMHPKVHALPSPTAPPATARTLQEQKPQPYEDSKSMVSCHRRWRRFVFEPMLSESSAHLVGKRASASTRNLQHAPVKARRERVQARLIFAAVLAHRSVFPNRYSIALSTGPRAPVSIPTPHRVRGKPRSARALGATTFGAAQPRRVAAVAIQTILSIYVVRSCLTPRLASGSVQTIVGAAPSYQAPVQTGCCRWRPKVPFLRSMQLVTHGNWQRRTLALILN